MSCVQLYRWRLLFGFPCYGIQEGSDNVRLAAQTSSRQCVYCTCCGTVHKQKKKETNYTSNHRPLSIFRVSVSFLSLIISISIHPSIHHVRSSIVPTTTSFYYYYVPVRHRCGRRSSFDDSHHRVHHRTEQGDYTRSISRITLVGNSILVELEHRSSS